jgi:hypothetical protein
MFYLRAAFWQRVPVVLSQNSAIPSLGASGAMASPRTPSYAGFWVHPFSVPKSRVLTLIHLIFSDHGAIPAFVLSGFWFVQQAFYSVLAYSSHQHWHGEWLDCLLGTRRRLCLRSDSWSPVGLV